MFSRRTLPVLIGLILLSGMFLMGQDTWGPGPPPPSSNLPDTGITKCYDMTDEIECPSPGEPFYGQDAQYTTNPMSYTDHGNGTVTDNVTGLMWQRCSAGLSGSECEVGTAQKMYWDDAIAYCEELNLAGHMDWRLPNRYELHNIVHAGRYDPAIDTGAFPATVRSWYWSSSSYAYDADGAWFVGFGYGFVGNDDKTGTYYARCARGEQTPQSSFTDNGDGTVTDNETGLVWQQQDDGVTRNWEAALAYCQDLDLGGSTDWRLPDKKELASIVDDTRYNPAIDPVFTATKSNGYWSSSTSAYYALGAWGVYFGNGFVDIIVHKAYAVYVRCVQ